MRFGIRAQLGLRLHAEKRTLGGVDLYSTSGDTISPEVERCAEVFADHAALALERTMYEEQLNDALSTRRTIGQATGIVMERFELNERLAFQYLVRISQQSYVKLRELAQELVEERNGSLERRRA